MEKKLKIYVCGHNGMVGSSILKYLKKCGYNNILTRTSKELDLTRQAEVEEFFAKINLIVPVAVCFSKTKF